MYHASPHLTYLLQTDLLKPDVSKLNYPLYPPWDWAEKSFRCYSHSANPLLTGVPAEGFGHLIASAACGCFSLKNGRPFQQFERTLPKTKVRFQKAAFFPVGGSGILIQVLPDPAPSSVKSCAKFYLTTSLFQ